MDQWIVRLVLFFIFSISCNDSVFVVGTTLNGSVVVDDVSMKHCRLQYIRAEKNKLFLVVVFLMIGITACYTGVLKSPQSR